MFSQSQAFPTEKNPEKARFCLAFFISKKSQRCSKKARISKSGFKKAKLATLLAGHQTEKRGSCWRDIVPDKEIFRRETRETLAFDVHVWLLFTEIVAAREISFPKSFYE